MATPRAGVTKVGEVARTWSPVPVSVLTAKFPDPSVTTVREAVRPEAMVPEKVGVVIVGEVARTTLPEPVPATEVRAFDPSTRRNWEAVTEEKMGATVKVATPVWVIVEAWVTAPPKRTKPAPV